MGWPCSVCTFDNSNMAATSCEICASPRPASANVAVPSSWACQQCTYENVPLVQVCGMCGGRRPGTLSDDEKTSSAPRQPPAGLSPETSKPKPSAPSQATPFTKMPDASEAKRLLEEATAKEKQRIEREKIVQEKVKAEKKAEIEKRRSEIAAEKREIEKRKSKVRLDLVKSRFEAEKKQEDLVQKAKDRRIKAESAATDIPSAVRLLHDRYGVNGLKEVLTLISKIVNNILTSPENEKFRTLKMSSPLYRNQIESRLGATAIMFALGFEIRSLEDEVGETFNILFLPIPDIEFLRTEYNKMTAFLNKPETRLPSYLTNVNDLGDLTLYFLMSFRNILNNIVIAPNSSIARRIDSRSDLFNAFFKPFPPSVSILSEFEFAFQDPFYVCTANALLNLEKGLRDLDREIASRFRQCRIAQAVNYIRAHNTFDASSSLVSKAISALTNVVGDMHQTRHHTIPLRSLFNMTGPIDGAREFLTSLHLDVDPESTVATVPYPYKNGVEVYRLALDITQLAWKKTLKTN